MQRYEYRVIPAPRRGEKAKGVKTTEERFALALTHLMNELGAEGWDYIRADALPVDERAGLTGTRTSYQNMLVFRRPLEARAAQPSLEPTALAPREVAAVSAPVAPAAVAPLAAPSLAAPSGRQETAFPAVKLGAPNEAADGRAAPALGPAKPELAAE
ncbi:DUF4177 domain-containing protein [Pseudogemmobacter sonorensis]|uniref:DUF4177 domain-containing protein n=1 Tax=Pseudogemmobacter sonorensis TaxID=2989681 RepID=UPI0036A73838